MHKNIDITRNTLAHHYVFEHITYYSNAQKHDTLQVSVGVMLAKHFFLNILASKKHLHT